MTDFLDANYLGEPQVLRLRNGEDRACEDQAAAILATSREGVTALCDKRDYLTKDQLQLRWQKEVPNQNGVAEESLFGGLFKRSHNPLANSRPSRRSHSGEE